MPYQSKIKKIINSKEFIIFIFSFFLIAVFMHPRLIDPAASRVAMIRAIVEHRTLVIDSVQDVYITDKIYKNGHFYSDKPPLPSLAGALIYFILYHIFHLKFSYLVYYLFSLIITGLSFALLLTLFYKLLGWFKIDEKYKILFTFSLGFATLLFPYSSGFSNHPISALLVFLSFYYLLRINPVLKYGINPALKKRFIFLSGLFASLAVATEFFQGLIFATTSFIYLLLNKESRKIFYYYILGILPIALLYIIYNLQVTGNILPPYLNLTLYQYPDSYWLKPAGVDAFNHPKLLYLFNILVGSQGIFLYSPILLFGVWGLIKTVLDKKNVLKKEAILILSTLIIIIAFLVIATSNYSGASYGFRWFIICYPCLFFFVIALANNIQNKRFAFYFFLILFLSFLFAYMGLLTIYIDPIYNWFGIKIYFPLLDKIGALLFYISELF